MVFPLKKEEGEGEGNFYNDINHLVWKALNLSEQTPSMMFYVGDS